MCATIGCSRGSSRYSSGYPCDRCRKTVERRKAALKAAGPKPTTADIARMSFEQKGQCFWCSVPLAGVRVHVDHVVPLARGGTNAPANTVLACEGCNTSRQAPDSFSRDWRPELGMGRKVVECSAYVIERLVSRDRHLTAWAEAKQAAAWSAFELEESSNAA